MPLHVYLQQNKAVICYFIYLIVQQRYRYNGDQRVHYPRAACHKYGSTEGQRVSTIFTAISWRFRVYDS